MQSNDLAQHDIAPPSAVFDAHENALQVLSTLMLQVEAMQTMLRSDQPLNVEQLRSELATIEQLARQAIDEIRLTDDDPQLPELLGLTLEEALTRAVEETAEALRLSSRVSFSGEEHVLPTYTERLFYRITQEALLHIQQRANARKLRFTFVFGRDEVMMSIEDDGTLPSFAVTGEGPLKPSAEEMPLPYFQVDDGNALARDAFAALRHRIEHLGGTLEVGRDAEQGTRVQVRVPYTIPTSPAVGTQNIAPSPLTKITLVVVDNQSVSRAGLRRLLESYADLRVIGEAADGVQAVSETLELGPQVVLMDAHLPNNQSIEALKQIKQLNLNARVLLLSAQNREEYLYETLQAGADGYVLKDIVPDELAAAVRAVARGEVLIQPTLASRLFSRFGKQSRSETLTAREHDVLQLLARGLRNKEIAARLYVSERTVNFHLANIYQKLNVSGRTEALSKALEQGLVTV
jgi:DNA-binding NarL/FixJ family response regulator